MGHQHALAGALGRAAGKRNQFKQAYPPTKLELTRLVHCSHYGDRIRTVFLDEDVDVRTAQVLQIARCYFCGQLGLCSAAGANLIIGHWHANHPAIVDPHRVTRELRTIQNAHFEHVRNGAVKSATDPDLDLILIHSPAPHPPGIYDTAKNDFSRDGKSSYVDNLKLVDRTLSDLRRAMENSGMWDKTTVIISSDHWWRTEMWSRGPFWTHADAVASGGKMDHRIPFMVRLAGQNAGITYTPAFNTVVTHDLILALLRGEVSNPDSLTGWLDHHRSISDSPYNRDDLLP